MINMKRNLLGLICAMLFVCLSALSGAANPAEKSSSLQAPLFTFNEHDFVRAKIAPMRTQYFVGEPIVVPIILSNHTRFPLTIETNLIPRGNLKVQVKPRIGREFPYYGPYKEGVYSPISVYLYSLENARLDMLIWGDSSDKSGMAFSKPGQYTVKMELLLDITDANIQNVIPLKPFTLTINPTPEPIKPIIEELKKNRGFLRLHMREVPEGWNDRLLEIVDQYDASTLRSLTPYLNYVAAKQLKIQYEEDPDNAELLKKIQFYYQVAAASDSIFKYAIHMELLRFLDKAELYTPAQIVARQIIKIAPRHYIGKFGSNNVMLRKYLVNTQELTPVALWTIYP